MTNTALSTLGLSLSLAGAMFASTRTYRANLYVQFRANSVNHYAVDACTASSEDRAEALFAKARRMAPDFRSL